MHAIYTVYMGHALGEGERELLEHGYAMVSQRVSLQHA